MNKNDKILCLYYNTHKSNNFYNLDIDAVGWLDSLRVSKRDSVQEKRTYETLSILTTLAHHQKTLRRKIKVFGWEGVS